MLKMFNATIRDGALVLPDGADLGLSRDGDQVQVAVEVDDEIDRAGVLYAATRPSQFRTMFRGDSATEEPGASPEREELWPEETAAHLRSPRTWPNGNHDPVCIGPREELAEGEEAVPERGEAG